MPRVLLVWWSASATENIDFGLATRTWGLRSEPSHLGTGEIDFVLFGRSLQGPSGSGSPRVPLGDWRTGNCDFTLAQASGEIYVASAPHWPDESPTGILYPYRLGFISLGTLRDEPLDGTGVVSPAAVEELRQVAITSRTSIIDMDVSAILAKLNIATEQTTGSPDLPALAEDDGDLADHAGKGAGRTDDPQLRRAVETYSVELAIQHMKDLGWTQVEELGKPFDLVCTKDDGSEKHIEVKGSTGAAFEVHYTSNEVMHFRTCPFGADLIVVRDISVEKPSYACSGGELLHVESYTAPDPDLQVTRYRGRVQGW